MKDWQEDAICPLVIGLVVVGVFWPVMPGRATLVPTADPRVHQKCFEFISHCVIARLSVPRVLELGVGDQVGTPKQVAKSPDVTSVDGSAGLMAALQQRLAGQRWTPAVSLSEDYTPAQPFVMAPAAYVLEHGDDPTLASAQAQRLAVKRGLCSSPAELGDTDRRMGHKWCFAHLEMEKLIVGAAFRIIEPRGLLRKAFPKSSLGQCDDQQLHGLFGLGLELPIDYAAAIFFLAEIRPS